MTSSPPLKAEIPGYRAFRLTRAAADRITELGGVLHCSTGPGGCRMTLLRFSRTVPAGDVVQCHVPDGSCRLSVAPELAPYVDRATLDYGPTLKPPRFRWIRLQAPNRCACRRSFGAEESDSGTCMSGVPQQV